MRRNRRTRIRKPEERLSDDMRTLREWIENPSRFGAFVMIQKMKNTKYKIPLNINLFDFKEKMEREIKRTYKKIERKFGFELPDGIKK